MIMEQYFITAILSLLNLMLLVIVWIDIKNLSAQIFDYDDDGTDNEDSEDRL